MSGTNGRRKYATQVETYLENIVPSEDGTANIYANSKTEYVSFRADDIIVGEDNIKISCLKKIEKLVNIKLINRRLVVKQI